MQANDHDMITNISNTNKKIHCCQTLFSVNCWLANWSKEVNITCSYCNWRLRMNSRLFNWRYRVMLMKSGPNEIIPEFLFLLNTYVCPFFSKICLNVSFPEIFSNFNHSLPKKYPKISSNFLYDFFKIFIRNQSNIYPKFIKNLPKTFSNIRNSIRFSLNVRARLLKPRDHWGVGGWILPAFSNTRQFRRPIFSSMDHKQRFFDSKRKK